MKASEETIANKIKELCKSRSQQWANKQAEKLMAAAAQNPFQKTLYHSLILSLDMYINMLLEYKKHLSKLEDEIDALAKKLKNIRLSNRSLVSVKKSLPRLFLKLGKLIDLITLRN